MLTAVLVALSLTEAGQVPVPPPPPAPMQGPVRDPGRRPPPEVTGTGIIRGRLVFADTGQPVRRGQVALSMMAPPRPAGSTTGSPPPGAAQGTPIAVTRTTSMVNGVQTVTTSQGMSFRQKSATTDAQGAFEFKNLPPGTYRLMANPAQYSGAYLPTAFGARKPNAVGSIDSGTPIELGDGETFDRAAIGLLRGGVVSGRVTDENGEALARVQVYPILFTPGSPRGMRTGSTAQTDDLGQYRLFGLAPGDYIVVAEARGNTFVAPGTPPPSEEDLTGFITTYYPGTADDGGAQRVRARAGAETPGIEIRMVSGRLFQISGMVTDSQGRSMTRSNGTLYKRTANSASTTTFGFSTDEQGRFQMRNVAPGEYRLNVRQQMPPMRNPDGTQSEQQGEFASMPLSVASDMENILVVMNPGAAITGHVVLEGGPPPSGETPSPQQIRVQASMPDPQASMGMPTPAGVTLKPDLTFTMKGFMGEFLIRANAPNYYLKSVSVVGADITDTPREFKNGDRVTIVMTSRASTLEGLVTDDAGKPVTDAGILLFSDDKAAWRTTSIRTRRSAPDGAGRFRMTGLPSGRYFLIALPRERLGGLVPGADSSLFEAFSKEATTLVLGEEDQRQVDLKLTAGGGGH